MMIDNKNILIISPTYNEIQNIELFINSVLELNLNLLIIDDGSPDGTAQIVKKSEKYNKKLFLIIENIFYLNVKIITNYYFINNFKIII